MIDTSRGHPATDRLFRTVIGAAILLGVLPLALIRYWGAGPVLAVLPWFTPMVSTFQALTCLSVGYLAWGRYRVLHDPASFWSGLAFAGFGIGLALYTLTWPALMPNGQALLGQLPNTSAWIGSVSGTLFGTFLLAAAVMRQPEERSRHKDRSVWIPVAWLTCLTLFFLLSIADEPYLPVLVTPTGAFAPLLLVWNSAQAILFVIGAALSVRRYFHSGDLLPGYATLAQMAFAYALLATLVGGKRYDLHGDAFASVDPHTTVRFELR
jgi:hypothetical protein